MRFSVEFVLLNVLPGAACCWKGCWSDAAPTAAAAEITRRRDQLRMSAGWRLEAKLRTAESDIYVALGG